jgi:hypothetical protein
MVDDIIFGGSYFFIGLPIYDSGTIARIEAQSEYYTLRLALPERISVG